MGSLGFQELLLILGIALIVFGPKRLPTIGKSLGKALGELRRASADFRRTLEEEVAVDEIRQIRKDINDVTRAPMRTIGRKLLDDPPAPQQPRQASEVFERPPASDGEATIQGSGSEAELDDSPSEKTDSVEPS